MRKIQDLAAFLFMAAVTILTIIAILGIWDFFNEDIIEKSFKTIGLFALIAIVVVIAGKFARKSEGEYTVSTQVPNPLFKSIRRLTLGMLIVSASLLALIGALAIWEVISDKEVLQKSLATVATLVFSSFIIVLTSLEREGIQKMNKRWSIGGVLLAIFLAYLLVNSLGLFF